MLPLSTLTGFGFNLDYMLLSEMVCRLQMTVDLYTDFFLKFRKCIFYCFYDVFQPNPFTDRNE